MVVRDPIRLVTRRIQRAVPSARAKNGVAYRAKSADKDNFDFCFLHFEEVYIMAFVQKQPSSVGVKRSGAFA